MERYTITDVRSEAAKVAKIARDSGADVTRWGIEYGDGVYSFAYRPPGQSVLTVIRIGSSAREATRKLQAIATGMLWMKKQIASPHKMRALSAALRASAKLDEHRQICNTCAMHLVGAAPDWCDQYKMHLRVWREGVAIAQADKSDKYPTYAVAS